MATRLKISSNPVLIYAEDVLEGRICACEKVTLACDRFVRELAESSKPRYPYRFDLDLGMKPVRFMEQFLRPTKGDSDRLRLMPWQIFVEGNLYGWIDKEKDVRRFREGLVVVGRGNGKSTLLSGNGIYGASKDGERGADVYLLSNVKEQAKIVGEECAGMIDASPILSKHFRALRDAIYYDKTSGRIKALASDSKTLHGLNAHMAIFDEIHEFRDYKLITVIRRSMIKRRQPLIIYITTLGKVLDGPLMQYYVMADNVLKGNVDQGVADRIFCYVAELDSVNEIEKPDMWIKANPSIGPLLKLDEMIEEWGRAKQSPDERSDFINTQLNMFTNTDEMSFLDYEVIQRNTGTVDETLLAGMECYGGFDLSATEDFTSACLTFPLSDGRFFVLSHSWVPERKVHLAKEAIPYYEWQLQGHLSICPGEHIDQEMVLKWFLEQSKKYDIRSIGYDPAHSPFFVRLLESRGLVCNVVRQGPVTLTGPMQDAKTCFLDGRMIYNNNPMFRWYLTNVKLRPDYYDRMKGNWMPTKANKTRKIDGFMAFLFAHTEFIRKNPIMDPEREMGALVYELRRR